VDAVDAAFASLLRAGPPSLSRTPSLRVDSPSHSVDSPTATPTDSTAFSPVKLEEPTAEQVRAQGWPLAGQMGVNSGTARLSQ
jgi:hypothetical protein